MGKHGGRGHAKVTERGLREYLEQQPLTMAGTTQIAEEFDVARPSIMERLKHFEEHGMVRSVEIGQSYGWYLRGDGHVNNPPDEQPSIEDVLGRLDDLEAQLPKRIKEELSRDDW